MTQNQRPKPPIAKKIPHKIITHNDTRVDNYFWMRLSDEQKNAEKPDTQTQCVLNYLNAENAYTKQSLRKTEDFQKKLFDEIVGRIKQDDESVPYCDNEYFYITRFEKGKEHPIYSRKKGNLEAKEEIMLDENQLAKPFDYYKIAGKNVSPNNQIVAFGEDKLSRRIYTIRFKNLATGKFLTDKIENTTGGTVWANDNQTVFYTRKDESLRSYKIFKHKLGSDPSTDQLVFHETDESFSTYIYKTKSKKYLVIGSYATLTQEYQFLNADTPDGNFQLFEPRNRDLKLEYDINHYQNKWFVKTNLEAQNFRLMECPEFDTTRENWKEVIPHRESVLIEDVDLFNDFLVISERVEGITQLRIRPWVGKEHYIDFGEKSFMAYTSINMNFNTQVLRLGYTSLTTPNSVFDYDMRDKKMTLLKEQEIVGGYDKTKYQSERLFANSKDGTKIPISLVYKKGFVKDGKQPLLLYAYGSYGHSMDPYFSSIRLSLLDRGFAFAIAHIRGGEEMGRHWYEDGKLLNKKNTFNDFIDCGDFLVKENYTSNSHLYAMGGSAGGLLMGAIINMRPELWNGVVAAVPFVDVINTMLDETIPLTTGEFDEWGNPKDENFYHYIKSYSPYDNVEAKNYPSMLITTGYHDSQVQYWEPAKWLAKLRDLKTDNNILVMHCDMVAGHGGLAGRFEKHKETALEYAFLLDLEEIND
ncbi:S9 family peptidase [Saprospiraceae bacterium]|nr:S9 family peptidase [bacterium]MDC3210661.1 S9 family peptidase [Saprospiraceae bacterium]MDC3219906.1 S9 family peptidase [Saprospiraceae bacterium]